MRIFITILLFTLLSVGNMYSQCTDHASYSVRGRALGPNEYDKTKVQKSSYIKLSQSEAAKTLGDSIKLFEIEYDDERVQYVEQITYRNGKTEIFDGYETGIIGYYPELNIVVYGDCNADYVADMNTGERLNDTGDPQYECTSPSGKYRIAYMSGDMGTYFFQEKVGDEYRTLGNLVFDTPWIKGLYWADDEEIHYLGSSSAIWVAYTGNIKLNKE